MVKNNNNNVVLIVLDSLRNDHAFDFKRMPFLNAFKDRWNYSANTYTNAPSTHLAMPTMLTGNMPFETTDVAAINSTNLKTYLPKLFKDKNYFNIGISTNIVTSGIYGYDKYWDVFEDFWSEGKKIQEIRKNITKMLPKSFKRKLLNPLTRRIRKHVKTPVEAKEAIRGDKIIEVLKTSITQRNKNFIFLHFMEPHSPYIPKEKNALIERAKILNLKLASKEQKLGQVEVKELKSFYTEECKYLDKLIKRTIKILKANLNWKNTKIVITADHGEAFNETGYMEHPAKDIRNPHHHKVPLITKGFELNDQKQYWTTNIYNFLTLGEKTTNYKFSVCYKNAGKSQKGTILKYKPIAFFDLNNFKAVRSSQELPYKTTRKGVIENISI